jgi:hypothetical protein
MGKGGTMATLIEDMRSLAGTLRGSESAKMLREGADEIERLEEEVREASRICDKPGCCAVVVRSDDGSRCCAAGHDSRWVDKEDLRKTQEVIRLVLTDPGMIHLSDDVIGACKAAEGVVIGDEYMVVRREALSDIIAVTTAMFGH